MTISKTKLLITNEKKYWEINVKEHEQTAYGPQSEDHKVNNIVTVDFTKSQRRIPVFEIFSSFSIVAWSRGEERVQDGWPQTTYSLNSCSR